MLLAIDVGNTNITLGVFDGATLVQSWRLQTLRDRTADELGLIVDGLFSHSRIERVQVRGIILGSVVPPLTGTIKAMAQRYFGVAALTIEPGVDTGMPILYDNPAEVGADQRAARLPRIDVRRPEKIVGRTTVGAMESGLFWGYVGLVEGLVRRMSDELGGHAICVATGGLADIIAPETPLIEHVDPDLTLHGLRIVWERNQKLKTQK